MWALFFRETLTDVGPGWRETGGQAKGDDGPWRMAETTQLVTRNTEACGLARAASRSQPGRPRRPLSLYLVGGLWLLLAAVFRIAPLGAGGVWYDEIISIKTATFSPAGIQDWMRFDVHPPFYYLLLHGLMRLAQGLGAAWISTAWLRLSAALPSLATCAILAVWAGRAKGARAGVTALALAAVSPGLCFFGLELRNYALVMMFVAAAGYFLTRLLRRPAAGDALAFTLASLGHLYAHNLTAIVLAGNFAWALLYPAWRGERPGRAHRVAVYGSFLAILILYLPQLRCVFAQFSNNYAPCADLLPDPHWYDPLITMIYEFPSGPVETQGWTTPYATVTAFLNVCFLGLLFRTLWRARRRTAASSPDSAPVLAYGAFTLLFFLGATWAVTMLALGKLYYGYRTAMIVLPLWLLVLALLIESAPREASRRRLRWLAVALALPCAFLSIQFRVKYRSDFEFLVKHQAELDKPRPPQPQTYYITDERLAPWIASPGPGLHLAGLGEMLREGKGGRILLVNAVAERLQTDREALADACVRQWAPPPEFVQFKNPVYTLAPAKAKEFESALEAAWARLEKEIVREPRRLVLLPFCQEFNNSQGFQLPEFDQGSVFRWTDGPRQWLAWRAPGLPGRYQVRIVFWRPAPLPWPKTTVDYRIGNRKEFVSQSCPAGSVTLAETIETREPNEPLTLEMLSDYYIPANWIKGSEDRRRLGMMFLRLEMTMVPENPQ